MSPESGFLNINKPSGVTSHDVVAKVRRLGIKKVGHAGTLDPPATGVLVLCLGAATRLSEFLSTASKRYEAQVHFGFATRTYDAEGEVMRHTGDAPTLEGIERALPAFRGDEEEVQAIAARAEDKLATSGYIPREWFDKVRALQREFRKQFPRAAGNGATR